MVAKLLMSGTLTVRLEWPGSLDYLAILKLGRSTKRNNSSGELGASQYSFGFSER